MGKTNEITCEKEVDKMNEAISLKGLKILSEMRESERPKNWKELTINYLQHKEDWINFHTEREQTHNIDTFIEAIKLSEKLGILWRIKIKS